jgi:LacI family transcriptional regulator
MRKSMVKVDIDYIAMKMGMSKSTVSKALNDRADVSEKTKEKVRKFAKKLNYTPDRFAQALKMKKSNLIGIIMHEMRHEFFVEIARGITREAQKNGYQAVFSSSEGSSKNEAAIIDDLIGRYIDGLIIIPCIGGDASHLKELSAESHPCVIVDNFIEDANIPFIGTDFEEGGYIATKYLIEKGHSNIGIILGKENLKSTPERLAGCQKAFKEAGLKYKKELVAYGDYSMESGKKNVMRLLKNFPETSAMLCANTDISEGAWQGIMDSRKRMPDEISLMDFGGARFTAVDQMNEKIGQNAVQTLLRIFENKEIPEKKIIKPQIVDRNTVRSLPANL